MLPVAVAAVYETEKQEFVNFLRNLNSKCFEYFWQGLVLFSNKPGLCSNHYDQYICTIVQAFLGQSTYTVVCSTKHDRKRPVQINPSKISLCYFISNIIYISWNFSEKNICAIIPLHNCICCYE